MSFGLLITHDGTHSPEAWADLCLQQLVPFPEAPTADQIGRTVAVREGLRPAVVGALAEVRDHERSALSAIPDRHYVALREAVHVHHGKPTVCGEEVLAMHRWAARSVRDPEDWLEGPVRRIARAAMASDGEKVGHNEMIEHIHNVLGQYVRSLQLVERMHYVTMRDPVPARW